MDPRFARGADKPDRASIGHAAHGAAEDNDDRDTGTFLAEVGRIDPAVFQDAGHRRAAR